MNNTGIIDGHVDISPSNAAVTSFTQTAGTSGGDATKEYLASGTHAATFSGGSVNFGLIRHSTVEAGEVLTFSGGVTYATYPAIDGWETAIIATDAPYIAAARGATTRTGAAANVDVSAVTLQVDTEVVVDGTPLLGPGDHSVGMTVDMSSGGKLNFQDGATDDNWIFGNGTGGGGNDIGVISGGTVAMDMGALGATCTTDLIATHTTTGTLTHTGPILLDLATSGATTPTTQTGYCTFADHGNDGLDSFAALVAGATPTDVSAAYTLNTNPYDLTGFDYYVIEDADGNAALAWVGKVGIVVSKTSVATTEDGTDDSFTVVLEGPPSADVVITPASDNTNEATVSGPLTFTAANWNVPQTVTVTHVDDSVIDGDLTYNITLSVTSTDTVYAAELPKDTGGTALPATGLPGTNTDDDDDIAGDAGAVLSSAEQSRSAMGMLSATHDHVMYRLSTSGQFQDEFLSSMTLGRDQATASGAGLLGWYNLGISSVSLSGDAAGEGTFAYALAGRDLSQSDSNLFGILYGVEQGDWTYDSESDVSKTGLSFGVYNGRKIGTNLTLSTYLTYTRLMNSLTSTSGATASMDSNRLIGSVQLTGSNELESGASIRPYVSAQYAYEDLPAYTYSDGLALEGTSVSLGEYEAGLEITTPFNPQIGQFFGGFAISQTFGLGEITLSDGTIMSSEDEVSGTANIGWISNGGTDSVGRVELTIDGIGDDNRQETIVDAHLERSF